MQAISLTTYIARFARLIRMPSNILLFPAFHQVHKM